MRGRWCVRAMLALGLGACGGPKATVSPAEQLVWTAEAPLPIARSNNVVARLPVRGQDEGGMPAAGLFTALGLGVGRTHADILDDGWVRPRPAASWVSVAAAPERPGRLAATAQTVGTEILVFGGYTVAHDGSEVSTPHVDAYDATAGTWSSRGPMPLPVDDAVSGVWNGQVVIVSGWRDRANERAVQLYDPAADTWSELPEIPGTPVFGHAGGVVQDMFVYCDGVGVDRDRDPVFAAVTECHALDLGDDLPRWVAIPHHGRPTRYRAAATGWPARGWVVFAGGTDRPYNFNGMGYDGVEAKPRAEVFAWDVASSSWMSLPPLPVASMDHRGLVVADEGLWLIGGMVEGPEVSAAVWRLGAPRPRATPTLAR